uniref:Kynurenine 3-monooxygenase n=1 Tax=Crassostrea virginica TaxID=6565 RepID=A0A8B8DMB2_CRAVI|nr:kynurenine 3-monooxygenase-like [Crassostrea virginica]
MMSEKKPHVAVVGGGLVGALNACFLAKRGFKVDVYEKREDIRKAEHVKGRSINLALSTRGRTALRMVGLEDEVIKNGIPMHARMIHGVDGSRQPILYGKKDQFIMSVDRRKLNELLLSAAEKNPSVTCFFEHKLIGCDFKTGEVEFITNEGKRVKNKVDLIVGNDGAFSGVRKELMKAILLDFQQQYIPHGYMELTIPPSPTNEFLMEKNYLHIWPRNEFMMIALPNLDKSFTCTLFMPFKIFSDIKTEEDLMNFFNEKFPDSIPLMGEETLKEIYMSSKPLPMVSIKCSPYHVGDKGLIMGDAAHAMVPFYGQGMNAGFEDCIVLDEILDKYNNDFSKALPAYSETRTVDAQAICDLAMYNYIEMRKSVNSKLFLLRKKLDNLLFTIFPNSWIPLYTMVAFTRTRYHLCIERRKHQDEILTKVLWGGVFFIVGGCAFSLLKICNQKEISFHYLTDRVVELWESLKPV